MVEGWEEWREAADFVFLFPVVCWLSVMRPRLRPWRPAIGQGIRWLPREDLAWPGRARLPLLAKARKTDSNYRNKENSPAEARSDCVIIRNCYNYENCMGKCLRVIFKHAESCHDANAVITIHQSIRFFTFLLKLWSDSVISVAKGGSRAGIFLGLIPEAVMTPCVVTLKNAGISSLTEPFNDHLLLHIVIRVSVSYFVKAQWMRRNLSWWHLCRHADDSHCNKKQKRDNPMLLLLISCQHHHQNMNEL